jgi:phosphoribosylformylglycinamidine (FGAM) synthase-like enzyme
VKTPHAEAIDNDATLLFSESNSRFLCEVSAEAAADFEALLAEDRDGQTCAAEQIGKVTEKPSLIAHGRNAEPLVDVPLTDLKEAWQRPLAW